LGCHVLRVGNNRFHANMNSEIWENVGQILGWLRSEGVEDSRRM
jgi:hypothetical protein